MIRVLPRDAFNDANLLKCIGKLTCLSIDGQIPWLSFVYDGEPFDIQQDTVDGSTYVTNVRFYLNGETLVHIYRPCNSRGNYPLYMYIDDTEDPYNIFFDDGTIDPDLVKRANELKSESRDA